MRKGSSLRLLLYSLYNPCRQCNINRSSPSRHGRLCAKLFWCAALIADSETNLGSDDARTAVQQSSQNQLQFQQAILVNHHIAKDDTVPALKARGIFLDDLSPRSLV